MNEFDRDILALLSSNEKSLKISDLSGDSNPYLCDAGAMLHHLSHQVNKILNSCQELIGSCLCPEFVCDFKIEDIGLFCYAPRFCSTVG